MRHPPSPLRRAEPGRPEAVRRWVQATHDAWRLEPQILNGRTVEGSHEVRLAVTPTPT